MNEVAEFEVSASFLIPLASSLPVALVELFHLIGFLRHFGGELLNNKHEREKASSEQRGIKETVTTKPSACVRACVFPNTSRCTEQQNKLFKHDHLEPHRVDNLTVCDVTDGIVSARMKIQHTRALPRTSQSETCTIKVG